jgi:hypothetical protein
MVFEKFKLRIGLFKVGYKIAHLEAKKVSDGLEKLTTTDWERGSCHLFSVRILVHSKYD